jgi:hypothetical protein
MNFMAMPQVDVPQGRNGKHKAIVTRILSDLDQLKPGVAIRVPLASLKDSKEKVRSAVNRASRSAGRTVATASDDTYLYLWNE